MNKELFFILFHGKVLYDGKIKRETANYILVAESTIEQFTNSFCDRLFLDITNPTTVKNTIKGLYTVIVFDKKHNNLYIYQDDFSYFSHLYYLLDEDSIFCSLSLNTLITLRDQLEQCTQKYSLNSNVIREFLYSGFICGEETLLSEVHKLPVLCSAIYQKGRISIFKSIKGNGYLSENYLEVFEKKLLLAAGSPQTTKSITLSTGFDSNLILAVLNKHGFTVTAFTGIGTSDKEYNMADEICKQYNNVTHQKVSVADGLLDKYPEIVLSNEGALYERGIFLHYHLANVFSKMHIESVISGDGCDQVVSSNFLYEVTEHKHIGEVPHNPWETNPFEMLSYVVLKKSGMFLRKLEIVPIFPYLDEDFISVANNVRTLNGINKSYHKSQVLSYVKPEVAGKLIRKGGATEMAALFSEGNELARYKRVVEKCKLYSFFPPQPDRYGKVENECDDVLKVLYLLIFEKLYTSEKYRACLTRNADVPTLSSIIEN